MPHPAPRLAPLAVLLLAAASAHAASSTGRLDDTGISSCEAPNGTLRDTDCARTRQDAASGRDVSKPSGDDGRLGFSWIKLAADGSKLPADATQWACVADRVTGLVWEMKTTDGSVHDASKR